MVTSALPLLARAARDDADRLEFALQRLFEVALIAGVGVGLVLVVGAKPIIDVIAGPRYAGAVAPLRIEGAAVLGTCLTPVWSSALFSLHRHSALFICNLATLTITVGVTLALAPVIGARGAALGTVAGEWALAIGLLLALVHADRKLRPKARTVAPRVALAGAPAFATMLLPVAPVVQLVLAVALYSAIIVVVRALPRELLELLPSRAPRTGRA
jgi:O-antigen/teichoic acid export membrane protein